MRATDDQVNRLVDCLARGRNDLFQRWMAAAHDENDAVWRIDGERDLHYIQINAPRPLQQNQMEARRHLHRLGHPSELRGWPRAAELQRLGRLAVEITHVGRQRLVASIEGAWQSSAEDTNVLFWRVDRH